jgi:hypothetical protein
VLAGSAWLMTGNEMSNIRLHNWYTSRSVNRTMKTSCVMVKRGAGDPVADGVARVGGGEPRTEGWAKVVDE